MNDVIIKIDNVSKDFNLPSEKLTSLKSRAVHPFKKIHYKKQHALKNINLEIKRGEFFGIVGRNGSGKSTLLKLLAGIYQPTKGNISVRGKLVPFIELGVGFNPELSGRENVFLNGALLGFSEKEVALMYDDIVEFAELGEFMEQKLKNYSSGMQVRLAFSMAIRAKADILLIDEVLAVGDADFQRKCYEYFNELKIKNLTVVFVSHDMSAIQRYCDRSVLINEGKVAKLGNPQQISQQYSRLFINEAKSEINQEDGERWGENYVITETVSVVVNNEQIVINQKIKALKNTAEPTAGIRIRSSSGMAITGTSTELENVQLPSLDKDETIHIQWYIQNVLSDGQYLLDLDLSHNHGKASDWWSASTKFQVKKIRQIPYAVDPLFRIKIIK